MLKKGTRVEATHPSTKEIVYGVVHKGGSRKVEVVLDGAERVLSGPPGAFRESDKPLPVDEPSPMDRYEVKNYKPNPSMSEETAAFTATIYRDGKAILTAKNDGRGGCNLYWPARGSQSQDDERQLRVDAKAWAEQFGYENPMEAEDLWLQWAAELKPYGKTAAEYIGEFTEDLNRMRMGRS